jgi:hypothetical protein
MGPMVIGNGLAGAVGARAGSTREAGEGGARRALEVMVHALVWQSPLIWHNTTVI